jgi:hypothetical protein
MWIPASQNDRFKREVEWRATAAWITPVRPSSDLIEIQYIMISFRSNYIENIPTANLAPPSTFGPPQPVSII